MIDKLKHWIRSRTINYGAILATIGLIQANVELFHLTAGQQGWLLLGLGVATIWLRAVTTTALSER
jgi:hypothetical protein